MSSFLSDKIAAQPTQRGGKTALDRADRFAQLAGNLLVRQSGVVRKVDRTSLAFRQTRKRRPYALARANGNAPIVDKSLTGLSEDCVPCDACDATGMNRGQLAFRNIEFCKACSGRGYVTISRPKKPANNFPSLDTRRRA